MNIQRDAMGAVFPFAAANTAGAMLLAGLTLVPVSPIPTMCTNVSVRPMTSPPNEPCPASFEVTPRMVSTKMKVRITSTRSPATTLPLTPASPLEPYPPVISVTLPVPNTHARSPEPTNAPIT